MTVLQPESTLRRTSGRACCARATPRATLVRVGRLTSYLTETIVEDALAGGPGGRVEIELSPADSAHLLRTLRLSLDALAAHGIVVEVRTAGAGWAADRGDSAA